MGEAKPTRVGKAVKRTVRVTTGTAVAATEVMALSFSVTRRVAGKLTRPLRRGDTPRS